MIQPDGMNQETYLALLHDFERLKLARPTVAERAEAKAVNTFVVDGADDGLYIRFAALSGGSIDLKINPAQVIHLLRCLRYHGPRQGWMDVQDMPRTEPPLLDDPHQLHPMD